VSNLVEFLQNEPVALVSIAAIAVIAAFVFVFPSILNLIPAFSNKQTKEKHRRPAFLIATFLLLSIIAGIILLVPGVRDFLTPKKEEAVKLHYIYATVDKVDKKNNLVQLSDSTSKAKYRVKIDEQTDINRGSENATLSSINIGEPITITTKKAPTKGETIFAVEIVLIPPAIAPGGQN
jgi:uncharacterized membrane protein (UPF0182 family)